MVQCGGCWKRRTTSPGLLGNMYFTTTAATGRALGASPTHPRRNGVYTFGGGLLGRPGLREAQRHPWQRVWLLHVFRRSRKTQRLGPLRSLPPWDGPER